MAEFARTTVDDAAKSALIAFTASTPPEHVTLAIASEPGQVTTRDSVERALRTAAQTHTPPLALEGLRIGFVGCDRAEVRFVVSGVQKR